MANLKGQDSTIRIIVDGQIQQELTGLVSIEKTEDGELIEDDFLGETSKTYDHVFNGYKLRITAQKRTPAWDEFSEALTRAMRYQTGGVTQVDLLEIVRYPATGQVVTTTYVDVKSGPRTHSTGGRTDRVTFETELACSERVIG